MDELLFATLVSIEILAFNDFKFFLPFISGLKSYTEGEKKKQTKEKRGEINEITKCCRLWIGRLRQCSLVGYHHHHHHWPYNVSFEDESLTYSWLHSEGIAFTVFLVVSVGIFTSMFVHKHSYLFSFYSIFFLLLFRKPRILYSPSPKY